MKVYIAKTRTENRINAGEFVVAYNEEDLLLPNFSNLNTLVELSDVSFYHVGFKMGETLTSLRNLLPNAKLGGAELEDLYAAYSHKLFNNRDSNINMEVRNFLESTAGDKYEVVFSTELLNKYDIDNQKKLVNNMLASSTKYVAFLEDVSKELIGYIKFLGHEVNTTDNVTIVTKVEKKNETKPDTKDK